MSKSPSDNKSELKFNQRLIASFNELLIRLFRFNLKHAKTSLLLQLLLIIFFAIQVPKLRVLLNLNDLVDKGLPSLLRLDETKEKFNITNDVTIFFYSKDQENFNFKELDDLHLLIREISRSDNNIHRIISPFNIRKSSFNDNQLLYPLIVKRESDYSFEDFRKTSWARYFTNFTNQKSNHFNIEISFADEKDPKARYGSFDPNRSIRLFKQIDKFLKSKNHQTQNISYHVSGPVALHYYSFLGVKKTKAIHFIFFAIIMLVFYILWKKLFPGVIFLLLLFVAGIFCYGTMTLLGYSMELASSSLLLLIGISSLEDFVFLARATRGKPQKEHVKVFESYITPSFLTSLTTMIGFGSLYFSDLQVLERLGTMALIGAFIEWSVTFFLLPLILKFTKRNLVSDYENKWLAKVHERVFSLKLGNKLKYLTLVIFIMGLVSPLLVNATNDPFFIFTKQHPIRDAATYSLNNRGYKGILYLTHHDQRKNEIKLIENKLSSLEGVAHIKSPYDDFIEFSDEVQSRYPKLLWRNYSGTDESKKIFSREDNKALSIIYLSDIAITKVAALSHKMKLICDKDCSVSGDLDILSDFSDKVSISLYRSFYLNLFIVGLILFFLSYHLNLKKSLSIIYGALWGAVATMLLIKLCSIEISFVVSIYVVLLIGVTGDNAIQFLFKEGGIVSEVDENMLEKSSNSFVVSLMMALLCLSFLYSYFQPLRVMGPIIAIGLLISVWADTKLTYLLLKNDSA